MENERAEIDANEHTFHSLNKKVKDFIKSGVREIRIKDVNGQRYIGVGIPENHLKIEIFGIPGNDLGAFMNGPEIIAYDNCEDGIGNTMNDGTIIVHGHAGDIVGYSMRGGKIYIKENAGYRAGIHMKGYKDQLPIIVIGGLARDFLGEYMAGGRLIVLGLGINNDKIVGNWIGTGMHGGKIYIRGKVEKEQLGIGVDVSELAEDDLNELEGILKEYCSHFGFSIKEIMEGEFTKVYPLSHRPYGKLYLKD